MSKKGFILWLFTETPLHAGVGSGLGDIDLPLQRERTTGLPYVQASGIKGALRAFFTQNKPSDSQVVKALFGPDTYEAHEHAGALALSDARLLLFPVRSLEGVWAWITSPLLLNRLRRDIERFRSASNSSQVLQTLLNGLDGVRQFESAVEQKPWVGSKSEIILTIHQQTRLVLEEMVYGVQLKSEVDALAEGLQQALPDNSYWRNVLKKHLAILPDDELQFFAENATEVITRVAIDQPTKTVKEGALWTEELLPSETLLYVMGIVEDSHEKSEHGTSPVKANVLYDKLKEYIDGKCIQIGGDSTLGRGWCYAKLQEI